MNIRERSNTPKNVAVLVGGSLPWRVRGAARPLHVVPGGCGAGFGIGLSWSALVVWAMVLHPAI